MNAETWRARTSGLFQPRQTKTFEKPFGHGTWAGRDKPDATWPKLPGGDDKLARDGRGMRCAQRATRCQGWLEGYLLNGPGTGLLLRYEAFIHIIDSMFNQPAKMVKTLATNPHPRWRRAIASVHLLSALTMATGKPSRLEPPGSPESIGPTPRRQQEAGRCPPSTCRPDAKHGLAEA